MDSFLRFSRDKATCCLSLSEQTAGRLIEILLDDPILRPITLAELLVRDPSFCLWAACIQSSDELPTSLDQLAATLANAPSSFWAASVNSVENSERDSHLAFDAVAMPSWLRTCLADRNGQTPGSDVAAIVAQVVETNDEKLPSVPVHTPAHDEDANGSNASKLIRLVQKLARLEELESDFAKALEREKLASLRALAYGASHEINNPLANISTRAQTLLRDEHDPQRRRKLATINSQAFRANEMIADMMLFANPPRLTVVATDLSSLVAAVISELTEEAEEQGTSIACKSSEERIVAEVDPRHLSVAIKSMCVNSLEAIGAGGQIEVNLSLARRTLPNTNTAWVTITVRDTGPGISDDVRGHLFDPYFSGREAGRGLGLGLSKCWRIVTMHGGEIEVSDSDRGAEFTISLPTRAPAATDRMAAS